MSPEALEGLRALFEHIRAGRLPKGAAPRLAYCGHDVVHTYGSSEHTFRCLACKHEWCGSSAGSCPLCGSETEVYVIDYNRTVRWRCVACKFEWDGEDGTTCPSCNHDFPQFREKP